jgi:hypothetical protein
MSRPSRLAARSSSPRRAPGATARRCRRTCTAPSPSPTTRPRARRLVREAPRRAAAAALAAACLTSQSAPRTTRAGSLRPPRPSSRGARRARRRRRRARSRRLRARRRARARARARALSLSRPPPPLRTWRLTRRPWRLPTFAPRAARGPKTPRRAAARAADARLRAARAADARRGAPGPARAPTCRWPARTGGFQSRWRTPRRSPSPGRPRSASCFERGGDKALRVLIAGFVC